MSEVLIVSKTKMGKYGDGACIGGITLPDLQSVRLLNEDGSYHNASTDLKIGQVLDIEYNEQEELEPPHIENVLMTSRKLIKSYSNITKIVNDKKLDPITYTGSPSKLFDGKLGWTNKDHGYISRRLGVPNHSTGFWIPDSELRLDGKHYIYKQKRLLGSVSYGFKYVGFEKPIPVIPAKTKLRISLAKWWKPEEIEIELRCYLQLSGWYL